MKLEDARNDPRVMALLLHVNDMTVSEEIRSKATRIQTRRIKFAGPQRPSRAGGSKVAIREAGAGDTATLWGETWGQATEHWLHQYLQKVARALHTSPCAITPQ